MERPLLDARSSETTRSPSARSRRGQEHRASLIPLDDERHVEEGVDASRARRAVAHNEGEWTISASNAKPEHGTLPRSESRTTAENVRRASGASAQREGAWSCPFRRKFRAGREGVRRKRRAMARRESGASAQNEGARSCPSWSGTPRRAGAARYGNGTRARRAARVRCEGAWTVALRIGNQRKVRATESVSFRWSSKSRDVEGAHFENSISLSSECFRLCGFEG